MRVGRRRLTQQPDALTLTSSAAMAQQAGACYRCAGRGAPGTRGTRATVHESGTDTGL